jgi:hypothetical protein
MASGSVSSGIKQYNKDVKSGNRSAHAYSPRSRPAPAYADKVPF